MLKALLSSGVLVLLSMFLTRCESARSKSTADQLALGKQVYDTHCASCHGAKGEGQYPKAPYRPDKAGLIGAPPHDLTGHTWHHPDGVLLDIIRNGLIVDGFHPMPAFVDKLTDGEMQAVLVYIKTWWTPDQVDRQATASARYTPSVQQ